MLFWMLLYFESLKIKVNKNATSEFFHPIVIIAKENLTAV